MIDRAWFPERGCHCTEFGAEKRFGLGFHLLDGQAQGYAVVKTRTPWLELLRCDSCGTHWYAATDTEEADIYFHRASEVQVRAIIDQDLWPARFDAMQNVWSAGDVTSLVSSWRDVVRQIDERIVRDYLPRVRPFARGIGVWGNSTVIAVEVPLGGRAGPMWGREVRYAHKTGPFGLLGRRVITKDAARVERELRDALDQWLASRERRSGADV